MKFSSAIMTLSFLALSTACGSPSAPEITSITHRYESSAGFYETEERFYYLAPGQIDYIEVRNDGELNRKFEYFYNADFTVNQIQHRQYQDGASSSMHTLSFQHDVDGQLEHLDIVGGGYGADIEYRDGLPSYVRGRGLDAVNLAFDYDEDSRLREIRAGQVSLEVKRSGKLINSIDVRSSSNFQSRSYDYENGQVKRIRDEESRWDFEYDDAGRIARITEVDYKSGSRVITEYEYGAGDMAGVQPTPHVPDGFLFGMDGRPLDTVALMTLDLWLVNM